MTVRSATADDLARAGGALARIHREVPPPAHEVAADQAELAEYPRDRRGGARVGRREGWRAGRDHPGAASRPPGGAHRSLRPPADRRTGVAEALAREVVARFAARRRHLDLEVMASNTVARRLRPLGFRDEVLVLATPVAELASGWVARRRPRSAPSMPRPTI